jgi:zinc transport system substrate-binding protein
MKKILFGALLLIVIAGCKERALTQNQLICVSIIPEKYFVKQIVGNDFEVNVLIPFGLTHVDYEPTPSNMMALARSVAYFRIGDFGFEQSIIEKISDINSAIKIYNLSENIICESENHHSVVNGQEQHADQHIWMSARNAKIIAENIFKAVSMLKPDRQPYYQENLTLFCNRMDSLDAVAKQKLNSLSTRSFIIYHPALTYYASDYDLEQIAIEVNGKEPSAAWMQHVIEQVNEKNIRLLFVQQEYSQTIAEAIAEKTDIEIQIINPLSENWNVEFEHITDMISEKMK